MIRMQRPKLAQILSVYTKKLLAVGAPGPHSNYCLSLYLDIAGILQHPGKMLLFWGPGEILVTERVGTLLLTVWLQGKEIFKFMNNRKLFTGGMNLDLKK